MYGFLFSSGCVLLPSFVVPAAAMTIFKAVQPAVIYLELGPHWDQEVPTSGYSKSRKKPLLDCKVRCGMKCELGTPVTGPFLGIQQDYVCMGALAADETPLG